MDCSPRGFPVGSAVKNLPAMREPQEMCVQSLGQEEPLEKAWQPTPVFLPGESRWQRNPAGGSHRVAKSQTWLKQLSRHAQTVAHQTPLSMEFSRLEYWSGQPLFGSQLSLFAETQPHLPPPHPASLPHCPGWAGRRHQGGTLLTKKQLGLLAESIAPGRVDTGQRQHGAEKQLKLNQAWVLGGNSGAPGGDSAQPPGEGRLDRG